MNERHIMNESDRKVEWTKEKIQYEDFLKRGAKKFFESLDTTALFQESENKLITCSDEGILHGIRIPGSGILLSREDDLLELIAKKEISGITCHENCGAVTKFINDSGFSENPNAYGENWARNIASKAGINYAGKISFGNPDPNFSMHRPATFHNARFLYYTASRNFEQRSIPALPAGFAVSRRYLPQDEAISSLSLLVSLAVGEHGYGSLFTKDNPFIVVVIGEEKSPGIEYADLKAEVEKALQGEKDRVFIDGIEV